MLVSAAKGAASPDPQSLPRNPDLNQAQYSAVRSSQRCEIIVILRSTIICTRRVWRSQGHTCAASFTLDIVLTPRISRLRILLVSRPSDCTSYCSSRFPRQAQQFPIDIHHFVVLQPAVVHRNLVIMPGTRRSVRVANCSGAAGTPQYVRHGI